MSDDTHSSELHYEMVPPPAALEHFIACFWLLSGPKPKADAPAEIVLPDGLTEFIVHFGDPFTKLESPPGKDPHFQQQAAVLVSGQLTERIMLKPCGTIGVVAARFKPAGAARFFRLPFEEIVDQVVDFSQFEPQTAARLLSDVRDKTTHAERIAAVAKFLIDSLSRESEEDIFVRQACQYIMQSEGAYSVQEIVKLIGFSERQLERKFKKQVGISPKILSRIARFQKFIAMSKENNSLSLTDAALNCGYYDQSHFIRDFTKFSGVSPLNYLSSEHSMSDHFTTKIP